MIHKATLKNLAKHLNPSSQIVLRADFNVPIKDFKITDPNRIDETIPTIQSLLKYNPKSIVILAHLGRPNGVKSKKLSLKPVSQYLASTLNRKVTFLDDCVSESTINAVKASQGEVFLCENVRFHPQEEGSIKNAEGVKIRSSPEAIKKFRDSLTQLGNCYVNDAFGAAHRAHSSVVGISHKIRVAGLLLEKEIKYLGGFLTNPKKPVLVILGGGKVSDKIGVIENMINVADEIIIGGGMRYPFLDKIYGYKLGSTKIHLPQNPNQLVDIVEKARKKGVKLYFPVDNIIAKEMKDGVETRICSNAQGIPDGWESFDCGPQSILDCKQIVERASSIFWNGPMGVLELQSFKKGSVDLLDLIIKQTKKGATSIIGGGDSAALVNNMGLQHQLSYVSTGGGATLQLMKGIILPGIKNLSESSEV